VRKLEPSQRVGDAVSPLLAVRARDLVTDTVASPGIDSLGWSKVVVDLQAEAKTKANTVDCQPVTDCGKLPVGATPPAATPPNTPKNTCEVGFTPTSTSSGTWKLNASDIGVPEVTLPKGRATPLRNASWKPRRSSGGSAEALPATRHSANPASTLTVRMRGTEGSS